MPLETVQHSIHIRRKKNKVVFHNIARLWDVGRQAQSHQQILDGLHPWNAPITLKFDNALPILLGMTSAVLSFAILIEPSSLWAQSCLFFGILMLFWAFICYENDDPIEEVIDYLEQQTIAQKYQLAYHRQPQHISIPLNPVLFIAHLKRLFPLFDQGSVANDFPIYASTVWMDEQHKAHQVLVFQYHFVNEIRMKDKDGNQVKVQEVHRDLWGVFVFDIEMPGLAITTASKSFGYPYSFAWQTSDIQTNQRLKIYGCDQMQLAKMLTPATVLRIADFFQYRSGDLLFHPESNVLCYLGPHDLFKISSKAENIQDISSLRGHLRTFKLPHLEQLKSDLLQFLK
ncbi:hypothetical protein [Acinetobacter sp. GXMZU3951]